MSKPDTARPGRRGSRRAARSKSAKADRSNEQAAISVAGRGAAAPPFSPPSWPAMSPVNMRLADIKPYERNPRTHPPEQIKLLARLMREYGVDQPIVVDEDGVILKGHGRLMAAAKAGFEEFPVVFHRGLSEAEKKAMRIADNQVALLSGWDQNLLRLEIGELELLGSIDMSIIGFDKLELKELLSGKMGQSDPESVPEVPTNPVVRTGELWLLGEHRLMCGDATKAEDVTLALNGTKPHLMVTDPPYGVSYDPQWRNRDLAEWKKPQSVGAVNNDDRCDWRKAWNLFPGDVAYCWHPPGADALQHWQALIACGFYIRMQIIWSKPNFPIGRGNYHVQHEPCTYAVRKNAPAHWQGARDQTTVWQIDNAAAFKGSRGIGDEQTCHSTQKPVECMKRPIENNSAPGEWFYDPFVGSGTAIIAAEMTARKCIAIEINPAYCDVTIERWQNFSGKQATLNGKIFEHVKAERQT